MEIKYPVKEDAIRINKKVVQLNNDPFAVISEGNLEHLIFSLRYKFNNKPLEEAIVCKAALIMDLTANKSHIFAEGNKRTAVALMLDFLGQNGYAFKEENQKEFTSFVLEIASGKRSFNQIASWIEGRIEKV